MGWGLASRLFKLDDRFHLWHLTELYFTSKFLLNGSAFGVIFMPPPKYFAFPMQRAVTSGNVSHGPSLNCTFHVLELGDTSGAQT